MKESFFGKMFADMNIIENQGLNDRQVDEFRLKELIEERDRLRQLKSDLESGKVIDIEAYEANHSGPPRLP